VRFAKLDTEAAQGIAARYGIRSIPTMIVFKGGKEVARQSGAMDAGAIVRWLTPLVAA
jgi:thioredoxin 2